MAYSLEGKEKRKRKERRGRTKENGEGGQDKNSIKSSRGVWCLRPAGDGEYHQGKSSYTVFEK